MAYFLAHEISFLFPDSQRVLAEVWPAAGVGLASLLLTQRRHWGAVVSVLFISGFAADMMIGRTVAASIGYVAANLVESWVSAWLIVKLCGPEVRFGRVREVLALFAAAVFVNAGSALIGAGTAAVASGIAFWNHWLTWWVSDGLGILLITPLIVTWSDFRLIFRKPQILPVVEFAGLLVVLIIFSSLTFHGAASSSLGPRPYMVMGVLAWAGLRLGRRAVASVLVALAVVALTGRAVQAGMPFWAGGTQAEQVLAIQIYLAFVASTGFLLAAAYEEATSAELRLRALGDNLPSGAVYQVLLGSDGSKRCIYVSAGIEKLTGVPAEEITRNPSVFYQLILPEDRPAMAVAEAAAVRDMSVFQVVARLRRLDGQIRWMQMTSSPRRVENGGIVFDGIQTDITERKEAEAALQGAHAELSAIHAHAPVTLLIVDESLHIRELNESGEFSGAIRGGKGPGDALQCLHALNAPGGCGSSGDCSSCMVRRTVMDTLRNGTKYDNVEAWLPVITGDKSQTRCFLLFTGMLRIRDAKEVLVCVLDITERKQAELELLHSEARFRRLIEDAPIAISVSRGGRNVYANPSYLRMFGFGSPGEIKGRETLALFASKSRSQVEERVRRRAMGLPVAPEFEAVGKRSDGAEFPMLVAVLEMQFAEGPALVAFITDLTAPKKAETERARLEQQLRQAQKMESIGRLAGGVAHDFNNLLTVINGYSNLLAQKLDVEDRRRSYAVQIEDAGERAARLTKQLLAFSRQEVIQPIPVKLNATIVELEQMIRTLVGEDISVVVRLEPNLAQARVDPAQVDQVILNLVANARDAMPDGGRLEITSSNIIASTKSWVAISVSDTGLGMDNETREKIFEPFFTTKRIGKGTGLGLATVYGVMQQNGGFIDVQSAPGAGTTFTLHFPRIESEAGLSPDQPEGRQRGQGGKTILLVEDEDPVRAFLKTALENLEYHVLEASSAEAALQVAAEHRDSIDLLITDVVMPGMNGKALADRIGESLPLLKTIFMSGYLNDVIARSGVLDHRLRFLQKPITLEALEVAIREVLEDRPADESG